MKVILLISLLTPFLAQAFIDPTPTPVTVRTIIQLLDHTSPAAGTYQQHLEIYNPHKLPLTAPVIFFIGGESGRKAITALAAPFKDLNVIYMQADHRGYGSYSENPDQSLPTYVTSAQAVEDFHHDIEILKREYTGPCALYGASYPGTLAIKIASKYPDDAKVIAVSSGIDRFPTTTDRHDELMRAEWPAGVYDRMAAHIADLDARVPFSPGWQDRLFLQYTFIGSVQYAQFQKLPTDLPKIFWAASFLPTPELIRALRLLDHNFAGDLATNWARGQATPKLDLKSAQTGHFHGRYWLYQQCNELGGFWTSAGDVKVFPQDENDYVKECLQMFGVSPRSARPLDIKAEIAQMKTPMVYVTGQKDPWLNIQPQPSDALPAHSKYIMAPEGLHGPDRDDPAVAALLSKAIWERLTAK